MPLMRRSQALLAEQPIRAKPAGAAHAAILDAAEQAFGRHGFEGASMRAIAERAEVAQALLHYHFRNKETLYEAVFERRAAVIRTQRQQHLDEAFAGEDPVTLEDVLGILFMPLEDLLGTKRGDLRFYVQMVAEVTISSDERSATIVAAPLRPFGRAVHGGLHAGSARPVPRAGRVGLPVRHWRPDAGALAQCPRGSSGRRPRATLVLRPLGTVRRRRHTCGSGGTRRCLKTYSGG